MTDIHGARNLPPKLRTVLFVFLGVAGLMLKGRYSGPSHDAVRSYGGNFAVSFAVYFVLINPLLERRFSRLLAAGAALAVVSLFEALDGFGVMQNVYDPVDFIANASGVALAFVVDGMTRKQA
jgi:hypothetical protein